MTIADLLRRAAERFPAKPALLWRGRSVSYRALDRQAARFADALGELGIAKGGRIAVMAGNRPEPLVALFGAARAGCVFVALPPTAEQAELTERLAVTEADMLVYDEDLAGIARTAADALPKIRHRLVLGLPAPGEACFEDVVAAGADSPPEIAVADRDPACITFTGGATGRPKAVLSSHGARMHAADRAARATGLEPDDRLGIVTPLSHGATLDCGVMPALARGATLALLPAWSLSAFAAMARATAMTAAFLMPAQLTALAADRTLGPADFPAWRKLAFGGAATPDWVQRALLDRFPDLAPTQLYGQAETGLLTALPPSCLPEKLGAVGHVAADGDVAVVGPDGRPVGPYAIGEVVVRGAALMIGYCGDQEANAHFFRGGWGWTGDHATIDGDGFITLVDGAGEMIRSGGENIYPREIETVIYEHDAVAECAVFGIPDDRRGAVPAAQVVLKPGRALTEAALLHHCEQRLDRFKRPRRVSFVDGFPKTPVGKIRKALLSAPYWQGREKTT